MIGWKAVALMCVASFSTCFLLGVCMVLVLARVMYGSWCPRCDIERYAANLHDFNRQIQAYDDTVQTLIQASQQSEIWR